MRERFLLTVVGLGVTVALSSELFSWLGILNSTSLRLLWLLVALTLLARFPGRPMRPVGPGWMLVALALLQLGSGLVALVAPPNNIDSLTYHLTRVDAWVAQGHVGHFPTHDLRQLFYAPWAEYALLHLRLLSGGERLFNLLQWAAGNVALVAVSLLARHLGGGPRAQLYSALLVATVPMFVLQSSSTQNDLVVSMWLSCAAALGLSWWQSGQRAHAWGTCASLALAVLTKSTANLLLLACLPSLLWLLCLQGRRLLPWMLATLAWTLLLNGPFWWRNVQLSGDPLALHEPPSACVRTHDLNLSSALINIARTWPCQFQLPATPSWGQRALEWLHLRSGVALNDQRITFNNCCWHWPAWTPHENLVGAPLHVVTLTWGLLWALPSGPLAQRRRGYALFVATALTLLPCLLAWNPWLARLQLPLLVLACPLGGCALEGLSARAAAVWLSAHVGLALLCLSCNHNRPLLRSPQGPTWNIWTRSREQQYLSDCPWLAADYQVLAQAIMSSPHGPPHRVGLLLAHNDAMLWRLCPGVCFDYLEVENVSARLSSPQAPPQLLIGKPGLTSLRVGGRTYRCALELGEFALYREEGFNSSKSRLHSSKGRGVVGYMRRSSASGGTSSSPK